MRRIYLIEVSESGYDYSWSDIVCAFTSLEEAKLKALDCGYNYFLNADAEIKIRKESFNLVGENFWNYKSYDIVIKEVDLV